MVACGRRILGKASDPATAQRYLRLLSGRRHRVYTAIAVVAPDGRRASRVAKTMVRDQAPRREPSSRPTSRAGEWRDKAGGYAIQGRAEAFIPAINGSYSNVVGLPLAAALDLLRGLGWRPQPEPPSP